MVGKIYIIVLTALKKNTNSRNVAIIKKTDFLISKMQPSSVKLNILVTSYLFAENRHDIWHFLVCARNKLFKKVYKKGGS